MEVNVETVGENLPTENPDTAWENYLVNDYKKSNEQHQSDDVVEADHVTDDAVKAVKCHTVTV